MKKEVLQFLASVGLDAAALFAGLSGAVTTIYRTDRKLSIKETTGMLLVGMFAAGYLTPIISKWLNVSGPMQNALSFLIGMTGMHLVGGMLKIGRRFEKDPIQTARDIKEGKLSDDEKDDSEPAA